MYLSLQDSKLAKNLVELLFLWTVIEFQKEGLSFGDLLTIVKYLAYYATTDISNDISLSAKMPHIKTYVAFHVTKNFYE